MTRRIDGALPLTGRDVMSASELLHGVAHRTPVAVSRTLDELTGYHAFLKCESFQRTGSFKFRGAFNALSRMSDAQRAAGVTTVSSGNHAQGVALAARLLGVPAVILMPTDAPRIKVEATRSYGATVEFFDRQVLDAEEHGLSYAEHNGFAFIPAFDHRSIMAGQGTAALELLYDVADLDALVVPVGGGGIVAGTAVIAKHLLSTIAIFGVETSDANDTKQSLELGRRVVIGPPTTVADGIRLRTPGRLTFPVVQALVDDVLVVSDDDARDAMRFLMTRMKLVIEPSGALPVAALLRGLVPRRFRRIGLIITGGNVDPVSLATLWPSDQSDELPRAS